MAQDLSTLPAPAGDGIAGNLTDLGRDSLGFLTTCRDYGDIVPLRLGLTSSCVLTNPEYIEPVLKNRDTFIKSRGFRVLKTLLGEGRLRANPDSRSDDWRNRCFISRGSKTMAKSWSSIPIGCCRRGMMAKLTISTPT
jgi:hypothetical protein